MAGNFSASAGAAPAQGRTYVQGSYAPVRQAPAPQVPAGYQLVYRMGGPNYMYGLTPEFGARYGDGRTVPGQIYGNMPGSREGADMFGFFPTMFQSQPYATASQMYSPGLGVMPLIGYPSKYPHVVMGGYTDYGAPIANQAINMMLPLLMMGLYRQMFPMAPQAPAATAKGAGGGGKGGSGGGSGGGSSGGESSRKVSYDYLLPPTEEARRIGRYQNLEEALAQPDSGRVKDYKGFDPDYAMRGVSQSAAPSQKDVPWSQRAARFVESRTGIPAEPVARALDEPLVRATVLGLGKPLVDAYRTVDAFMGRNNLQYPVKTQ